MSRGHREASIATVLINLEKVIKSFIIYLKFNVPQ